MNKMIYVTFLLDLKSWHQTKRPSNIIGLILDENFKLYPTYISPVGKEIKIPNIPLKTDPSEYALIKTDNKIYHPRYIYKIYAHLIYSSDVPK